MKKNNLIPILCLILILLSAVACSGSETANPANPNATTPAPVPADTPAPTAVPSPTPAAYDYAVASSVTSCRFADDYGQVVEALEAIRQPAADIWSNRFAESGQPRISLPEVTGITNQGLAGDSIACGGNLLFILDGKDLVILSVTNGVCMPISRTEVGVNWTGGEIVSGTAVSGYEKTPLAVYPFGDRIAVIYDWYGYTGSAEKLDYTEYTAVDIYSISNPASPIYLSGYGQSGTYRQSVLVRGILYIVTDHPLYGTSNQQQADSFLPSGYVNGTATPLTAGQILLPGALDALDYGYTVIGSYQLQNAAMTDVRALLGTEAELDVAEDGFRFLRHRWAESPSRLVEENGEYISEYVITACTDIVRLSADSGTFILEQTKTVNGWIPDCSAIMIRNESMEYVSELLQGLYSPDGQGGILWRSAELGIRLGSAALYDSFSRELDLFGGESISWAGLLDKKIVYSSESGRSYLIPMDADTVIATPLSASVRGDVIMPWGDEGYLAFYQTDSGRMNLSVRDSELQELAVRSFGSDHSNTLESWRSYYSDRGLNLIGFASDDSYCFYSFETGKGLSFRTNIFMQDWAWNSRAYRIGDRIAVVNTAEVFLVDLESLKVYADYTV